MRTVSDHIIDTIASGNFTGDDGKPSSRLAVVPDWWLFTAFNVGNWPAGKFPVRYFLDSIDSLDKIEVPNLLSVDYDDNISDAAGSATFTIGNQIMDPNLTVLESGADLGNPGYLSPDHGQTLEAQARWGQTPNEWAGRLVEGAQLRLYQGYGGQAKTLEDAIDDGNVVQEGIWFVDDVQIDTSGNLVLSCRNAGVFLVDQLLYPPLLPPDFVPPSYARWIYTSADQPVVPVGGATAGTGPAVTRKLTYLTSSADAWYGPNFPLHGHPGTDSLDNVPDTYSLGPGNSRADAPWATDYWEYGVGAEEINAVTLRPWAGNYTLYISIMEHGVWCDESGEGAIPYDVDALIATGETWAVDTHADIPFSVRAGTPWEQSVTVTLPRTYRADRIRLTFRDQAKSQWGPWLYRAGIREVAAVYDPKLTGAVPPHDPWFFAAAAMPHDSGDGYWIVGEDGTVFAFGDARVENGSGGALGPAAVHDIEPTATGLGYWLLGLDGRIRAHGDAVWFGDLPTSGLDRNDCNDMARTPTGLGYWILSRSGRVYPFGDATYHGEPPIVVTPVSSDSYTSIESHPSTPGYRVLHANGEVHVFDLTDHGSVVGFGGAPAWCARIHGTRTGEGYWVHTINGLVYPFGDAGDFGEITDMPTGVSYDVWRQFTWELISSQTGNGYRMIRGNGTVIPFGDATMYGGPGTGLLRSDGNYTDYADIIVDIALWCGFHLFDGNNGPEPPPLHGEIESTGAWSTGDPLPISMFDKQNPIDPIKKISEAVGYILMIDWEGAFIWRSPNFWQAGNWLPGGEHTTEILEIDEKTNLFDYEVKRSRQPLRDPIIISTEEPTEALDTTVTTILESPPGYQTLRGMVKPTAVINGAIVDPEQQKIMAELIAIRLWFASRVGKTSCVYDPRIRIDDQVRVFERYSTETNIHYVRGRHVTHDVAGTGELTMTLDHYRLGSEGNWVIVADVDLAVALGAETADYVAISDTLLKFLQGIPRLQGMPIGQQYTTFTSTSAAVPSGGDGAGPPS